MEEVEFDAEQLSVIAAEFGKLKQDAQGCVAIVDVRPLLCDTFSSILAAAPDTQVVTSCAAMALQELSTAMGGKALRFEDFVSWLKVMLPQFLMLAAMVMSEEEKQQERGEALAQTQNMHSVRRS